MIKHTHIPITQERLTFIDTQLTTAFLKDNSTIISLDDYHHHHNILSNLLVEADIPIIFMSMIMRINKLENSYIPKEKREILIPSPHIVEGIIDKINSMPST